MNPEHQQYLPAIALHAKEWVLLVPQKEPLLIWNPEHWRAANSSDTVFETELLQLMQWIEERERLSLTIAQSIVLEKSRARNDLWHERWRTICKTKGWKETL